VPVLPPGRIRDVQGHRRLQAPGRREAYAYEEYYLERLPVTAVDHAVRTGVKKLINFKD